MSSWMDIPSRPNYQANMLGQIRNKRTGHILKPSYDRYGYQKLSLGNADNVQVHRLVCEAFYGPAPDDTYQVDHGDTNRSNNHISNLQWTTPSENIKHGVRCGNIDPVKASMKAREVNMRPVRFLETGEIFPSILDCANYLGVKPTNVSRCLTGSRKGQRLHGYHIEYA